MNSSRKIDYLLHLADNALLLGHRNSEWCGHGPVLEQDIALTNISLDLIGQARNFYQYAAQLINAANTAKASNHEIITEDTLAYLRNAPDFKNSLLVELPNGDWAQTILRQFLFSNYQYLLYEQLQNDGDAQIAAIATKSLKEVTYHLRWSSEWVIRLGDGTEESHRRMTEAIEALWPYTGELFVPADYENRGTTSTDLNAIREDWEEKNKKIFAEAGLIMPFDTKQEAGGKQGYHSVHLEAILSEMQLLQRTYPNVEW